MPDPDFGRGIDLDQYLDINVSNSGDIALSEGREEVEKDLSKLLIENLDSSPRPVLGIDEVAEIRIKVSDILSDDPRVQSVRHIGVQPSPSDSDTLLLNITVHTDAGPFDFVVGI